MKKSNSLVEAAEAAGEFKTFLSLARKIGVDTLLSGVAFHTIFAPTDEAFGKFPKATLDKLTGPDHSDLLRAVVEGHVVVGQLYSARVQGKRITGKSLGGSELVIVGSSKTTVNGAVLIRPDILASNGVIHGIDRVLWPKQQAEALAAALA
jgi:uncharacterized surface protein with fasciclin (FAS1) repeats